MTETEKELIKVVADIAAINSANCHYTTGLADRIERSGTSVQDMTIREFLAMADEHAQSFAIAWR